MDDLLSKGSLFFERNRTEIFGGRGTGSATRASPSIAAEIMLADSIPWAMRPLKMVPAANSSLMWMALLSPDGGEQDDVGSRNGLGERGAHPDPEGLQMRNLRAHSSARVPWIVRKPAIHFWLLCQDLHPNASGFDVR